MTFAFAFMQQFIAWIVAPFVQVWIARGFPLVRIILMADVACNYGLLIGFARMLIMGMQFPIMRAPVALNMLFIFGTELLLRLAFVCATFLPFYVSIPAILVLLIMCALIHVLIVFQYEGNGGDVNDDLVREHVKLESCANCMVICFYIRALLFVVMSLAMSNMVASGFITCANATLHFLFERID